MPAWQSAQTSRTAFVQSLTVLARWQLVTQVLTAGVLAYEVSFAVAAVSAVPFTCVAWTPVLAFVPWQSAQLPET